MTAPAKRLKLTLAACGTALAFVACADVFGVHNADVTEDASGIDAQGADGGDAGLDAPPDAVGFDQIVFDVNTAACDGSLVIVPDDAAVWVSGSGADGPGCGTPSNPCKTIANALAVAQAGAIQTVYLDHATFKEAVDLGASQGGMTLQGGFERTDAGWVPECDNSLTTILGPDQGPSAAVDIHGADNVTLRLMQIESKLVGATGESVYALRVVDTSGVKLDNVTLIAQHGGDGANGEAGASASGCGPSGGSGAPGGPGTAGGNGTWGGNGFTPSSASTGTPGQPGPAGTGSPGTTATCNLGCP